jgi:molecular chaperone HscC
VIIGIDLGTTNSAVGVWKDGRAQLVPNSLGDVLTPSAVGLSDSGELLVGMAARERQSTHPKLTATAFKRLMGTQRKVQLGKTRYSAEDLSALVLRSLKADVEAWAGEEIESAIITVPAYFNDRQRKATKRAGQMAGLKVERLINEPTAAALAHGIHERGDREPFLVFDLGGGTFDVSIVEIFDGVIEVRASAGDNRLGGEDFNDVVASMVMDHFSDLKDFAASSLLREIVRAAAERTRRTLSNAERAPLSFVWAEKAYRTEIDAAAFEEAAAPLVARLREPVLRSLRDSNIVADTLSEIVMVGGATRMPVVRKALTRMFGRFPTGTLDPDQAVALGAAVQAGLRSRDEMLEEIRLTDVCPFTLGIETADVDRNGYVRGGIFSPIIERNTVIPASRIYSYSTMYDNQDAADIRIYQGEARDTQSNIFLGEVRIPLPRKPRGVRIDCRFSYDTSGLLEVDVTVPDTGIARQLVVCDDSEAPDEAGIQARREALAALKVHPRDDAVNAAVLARAARCYESFLGEARDFISQLIRAFEDVLERQDPREIEALRREVEARLDELEGQRFL